MGEQWEARERPFEDGWNVENGGSREATAPDNAARSPGAEETASPSPAQPAVEPDYGDDEGEGYEGYVPDEDENDGVEFYEGALVDAINLYGDGYDSAGLVQALAEQEGPEAAGEFLEYWRATEQEQTPLSAEEYIAHLQGQAQAQALSEQLMALRAHQEQWQQKAVSAVDEVDKLYGKRYTQQLQESVAKVLAYENAAGTTPLDGTQSEAEVAAHLRDSYALAENFERLKARAELKRDFANTMETHR